MQPQSPVYESTRELREPTQPHKIVPNQSNEPLKIPSIAINNGISIPALGFGTFAKEISVGSYEGKTHAAVTAALEAGYRHLDCAWYYENEQEVGQALQGFLSRNPNVTRADIFVTTKVWPHLCGSPEDIIWSLESSLENLGLDYVDCFLVHWPFSVERTKERTVKYDTNGKHILKSNFTTNPELIWPTLELLQRTHKTRTIGVSNWSITGLKNLLHTCSIPPNINQVEIHPLFPNTELVSYCLDNHILPVAYSPLGSQNSLPGKVGPLSNNVVHDVARRTGASEAQVLIAWGIQRGCAVVPKSQDGERIKNNGIVVRLAADDMTLLNRISVAEGETRFVDPVHLFGFDAWMEE